MTTTVVGNTTRDPELRFTKNGLAMLTVGVAVNRKRGDEETTSFFDVVAFGSLAENVAESCPKGCRVVVTGRLEQRSWDTDNGERRSKVEIVADEIGPSLRWATCTVTRNVGERTSAAASGVQHAWDKPTGQSTVQYGEEPF